jgi:hypothetical protein
MAFSEVAMMVAMMVADLARTGVLINDCKPHETIHRTMYTIAIRIPSFEVAQRRRRMAGPLALSRSIDSPSPTLRTQKASGLNGTVVWR